MAAVTLVAVVVSAGVSAAQGTTFRGTLAPVLVDTMSTTVPVSLFDATPEIVAALPAAPPAEAQVLAGKLTPVRTLPTFTVVMVTPKAGDRTILVDLDQDGRFSAGEQFAMTQGRAMANLPVSMGVFTALPVAFRAPGTYVRPPETSSAGQARAGRTMIIDKSKLAAASAAPAKATIYASVFSTAQATIDIRGRTTLFQYQVDLVNRKIDPLKTLLYVDADGDGIIAAEGNVESANAKGTPLVFRAAQTYVATRSVDIATGEVVVEEHPKADYTRIELAVGKLVPDFAFKDADGRDRKLSDYRGKFVLLDFWGTWCGPCVGEIPNMKAAWEKFGPRGFDIIGMNMESPEGGLEPDEYKADIEKVRAFMAGKGATWTQAAQQSIEKLAALYLLQSYPLEILIGPDGTVAALDVRGKKLDETLSRLIK